MSRKPFQMYLSTALQLMVVVAVFLFLNLRSRAHLEAGAGSLGMYEIDEVIEFGWPFTFYEEVSWGGLIGSSKELTKTGIVTPEPKFPQVKTRQYIWSRWSIGYLALDFAILMVSTLGIAFLVRVLKSFIY